MDSSDRLLLRAASAIHTVLAGAGRRRAPAVPIVAWERCRRLARQIATASQRGWHRAARRLEAPFRIAVEELHGQLGELADRLAASKPDSFHSTERGLYADLVALRAEFGTLGASLSAGTLWVVTQPIVLEGIDLGRLRIELRWPRMLRDAPYQVTALDPRPASTRRDVVHPHVERGRVCEGDGAAPIRAALRQGRLLDFFLLVRGLQPALRQLSKLVLLRVLGTVLLVRRTVLPGVP